MNRSWPIWLILIVCALSILGAMGWQTQRTLSMERERLEANARAKVEERVRLALSRIDTAASAMLVIENQRPPEYYQAFYQPQVIFTNTLQTVDGKLVTQPSPLLSDPPEFIQLHFEVWAHRDLSSPQVPIGNHRDLAEASGISSAEIETSTRRLQELHRILNAPAVQPQASAPESESSQTINRSLQSSSWSSVPSGRISRDEQQELPSVDNYTVMVEVCQNGQAGWNVVPAKKPDVGGDWGNRELNELVSNSYNQPEEQTAYQQGLSQSERYKRQQVFEEVQYRAVKEAVYSKSMGKNTEVYRRSDTEAKDDAPEQKKTTQRLLVNPSSSLAWASGSLTPGAAAPATSLPPQEFAALLDSQGQAADITNDSLEDYEKVLQQTQTEEQEGAPVETGSGTEIVDIDVTPFRPLWLDGELLVVRQVRAENGMRFQGFWIDAEALSESLLGGISDLLPNAKLVPIAGPEPENPDQKYSLQQRYDDGDPVPDDRSLVTLPWRLEEGIEVDVDLAGFTPLHTSLGIGWIAVILAMVAAAMLVRGVLRMSERRAAFVSSVTHELRTPLTTFQLYSDLLAEGMVPEGEKRQSYLKTMRLEAGRLNHLIENVLSYSRIERGSARAQREKLSVASLVGRFESRLAGRSQRDGARLEINGLTDFGFAEVETDVTAVEQIIFNLVDNACKYGLPDEGESVLRLNLNADRKWVRLSICDSGKGIRRGDHRKLFRPFHKSAHDAAETKPGVGLGLALCRRLARALGGNLTVDSKRDKGACFELKLPRVQS